MSGPAHRAPYAGERVALLTRHGKAEDIAAELSGPVGCEVTPTEGFDTDLLGSFDGRVPRREDQLATARRKAEIGMDLTGLGLGLGSEGAFGPDPLLGLSAWDVEVVCWVDRARRLRVEGWAQGAAMAVSGVAEDTEVLAGLAARGAFPSHGLVLRPAEGDPELRARAFGDASELAAAFTSCLRASPVGKVLVESDLRAHRNPTRRGVIGRAAAALAARLAKPCPSCGSPGYGLLRRVPGLPCEACGTSTHVIHAEIHSCPACGGEWERPVRDRSHASASECEACNP